jgi:hypothetical protein
MPPHEVIYCAEARILISRERERLRHQALLLDALEVEIVRAGYGGSEHLAPVTASSSPQGRAS